MLVFYMWTGKRKNFIIRQRYKIVNQIKSILLDWKKAEYVILNLFAYLKKKRKIEAEDAVIYKELLAYVVIYIWTVNSKQLRFGRIPKNLHDFYFFQFIFLMISNWTQEKEYVVQMLGSPSWLLLTFAFPRLWTPASKFTQTRHCLFVQ